MVRWSIIVYSFMDRICIILCDTIVLVISSQEGLWVLVIQRKSGFRFR